MNLCEVVKKLGLKCKYLTLFPKTFLASSLSGGSMGKMIVLIGGCTAVTSLGAWLHFRGVFLGQKITSVLILPMEEGGFEFHRGSDYLLYIELKKIENSKLIGRLVRGRCFNTIKW